MGKISFLRRLPIKVQLSIITFIIIAIMVFIILSSYFEATNVVEQKNNEYFAEMISQINTTIASNCDVLKRLVQNISYSILVQEYLNETDETEKFLKYAKLKDYIFNMVNMKDGIYDIALINNNNGPSFNTNGDIQVIRSFKDEIPQKTLFYYTGSKTMQFNNRNRNCFIVGAKIYSIINYENNSVESGTLMIAVDVNALLGSEKKMIKPQGTKLYMIDRDGKVFFSNDELIKEGSYYSDGLSLTANKKGNVVRKNGEKYNVQIGDIPDIGGKIIFMVPQKELLSGIDDIRRQQLSVFLLALFLLAIPFAFVINNILQPLNKLMIFMQDIKAGKLKALKKRLSLQGYAEIIIMSNEFNNMLDEIDDLTRRLIHTNTRLYEMELIKKQSEMAYLKSQINPHFLYNTLESIKGIAVEEGVDKVFNMAKALGQVFRYSVKGTDIVSLNEELSIIKSYLYIQKIRFGNRLNMEYDISEDILECKVPKMFLQPIVENAIYHGIEPKVDEGHLWIEVRNPDNKLTVCIRDDGVGMSNETLEHLRDELTDEPSDGIYKNESNNNIGFANVNRRIKLAYGNDFGIMINSSYGVGTEVIITLPFER